MKTIEASYINILDTFVGYLHRERNSVSPRLINRAKFFARSFFIAYQYGCRVSNENGLSVTQLSSLFRDRFSTSCLFVKVFDMAGQEMSTLFDNETIPLSAKPIGELYESLLNYETSGLTIKEGKSFRNNLGSYYTPKDYAIYISKIAINKYLSGKTKDHVFGAKIADFSCGGGIFLTSALNHLAAIGFSNSDLYQIVNNIYACDVDPIALEIAKIAVLDYCNARDKYDVISNHFKHANFLIHSRKEETSSGRKLELAMDGFIYHQDLGISNSFLQEYDIILGNPPWEKIRFEEKKFFGQFVDDIQYINFKFDLSGSIKDILEDNPSIQEYASEYKEQIELCKHEIKHSAFFQNASSGELNTCSLFAGAVYSLLSQEGSAGLFVKSSLVTARANNKLFGQLINRTVAIYDFINTKKIFEIDGRERFSILVLGINETKAISLAMNLTEIDEIENKSTVIPISIFEELNPETKMVPNLSSSRDIQIVSELYKRFSIFSESFPKVKFGRLVHLTNHIADIEKTSNSNNLPVLEGKFFSLFDNAYSGFNGMSDELKYKSKASARKLSQEEKEKGITPEARFFITKKKWATLSKSYDADYMLAWHSLTSATNTRCCVASLLPFIPGAQSVQFLTATNLELVYLTGIFNSITFDYLVKSKLSGIDLTQAVINQIPVPSISYAREFSYTTQNYDGNMLDYLLAVVHAFYANDRLLTTVFTKITNKELKELDNSRQLFMTLDLAVAKLYGLSEKDFAFILNGFQNFYSRKEIQSIMEQYRLI